ncbi:MAG: LysM peptidoglycan-binding domain-containing protein, partial [Bacteroidetes bacterium]
MPTDSDTTAAEPETKGSLFSEWEAEAEAIEAPLQAFTKNYHYARPTTSIYDTLLLNTQGFAPGDIPRYEAEVIAKRLHDMPTLIAMDYNEYVQRYIDVYTLRKRDQVSRMLGLAEVYFPIYEEYLDREGLPIELKYLSVVESALNPHARSRVGATGLWQFMLRTGQMYGLRVNSFVDERRDPYKSTEAAMRYLKSSYNEFGDWLLAIASYNCGIGNVRKAIARSGGKRNFWEIREYLPRETRGYVPAFIAATYTFNYASAHNLYPIYVDFDLEQDTLHLKHIDITLQEISDMTGADLELLRYLNPELKLDRIPYSREPYVLRVPPATATYFAAHQSRIYAQYGKKRDGDLLPVTYAVNRQPASSTYRSAGPSIDDYRPAGTSLVYYTVRSGDVVGSIAEKYEVSPRQIAYWNDLYRYRIKVGQKLKIYAKPEVAQRVGATPSRPRTVASGPAIPSYTGSGTIVSHTIKQGDTLWGIA